MKRMNMKKGMALFLAMALATSAMTACGNKDDNNEPATEIDFNDVSNGENNTEAETEETSTTDDVSDETREGMYRSEITNEWIDYEQYGKWQNYASYGDCEGLGKN